MNRTLPLVGLAVFVAGCGGSAGQTDARETPVASAAAPATAAADKSARVAIEGFEFRPAKVTIARGGSVRWTDRDASNHNVVFAKTGPRDIDNLREGESASVRFRKRGTFKYVCTYHPGMAGTVVVR